MGSSSSKFRKHIQSGDEYAAIHLYSSSSDLRKALDPNLSYGDSYSHDTLMHMVARHAMKSLLRSVCCLLTLPCQLHCICMCTVVPNALYFLIILNNVVITFGMHMPA